MSQLNVANLLSSVQASRKSSSVSCGEAGGLPSLPPAGRSKPRLPSLHLPRSHKENSDSHATKDRGAFCDNWVCCAIYKSFCFICSMGFPHFNLKRYLGVGGAGDPPPPLHSLSTLPRPGLRAIVNDSSSAFYPKAIFGWVGRWEGGWRWAGEITVRNSTMISSIFIKKLIASSLSLLFQVPKLNIIFSLKVYTVFGE